MIKQNNNKKNFSIWAIKMSFSKHDYLHKKVNLFSQTEL